MNDTTAKNEEKMGEMMMARSGAERLMIGTRMFDDWRAKIIASLPRDLPPDEFKRVLFERISDNL